MFSLFDRCGLELRSYINGRHPYQATVWGVMGNVRRSNRFEGPTSLSQSDFAGREIIDSGFYLQFAISNRIADDG